MASATRADSSSSSAARNSQDNPFYPTRGTRLSWTTELAGGPFGGSINFHKHRVEGRAYLPSVLKSVTTMLRARVGMVDQYRDQNYQVPTYERFRLGGGGGETTPFSQRAATVRPSSGPSGAVVRKTISPGASETTSAFPTVEPCGPV